MANSYRTRIDLVGQQFGKLKVIEYAYTLNQKAYWRCLCECGKVKAIVAQCLRNGSSKSCGCLQREFISKRNFKHGSMITAEYRAWSAMRMRCLVETDKAYPDYGGRGITIEPRWNDFENFIADMGKRPSPEHSLERKDNEKGYSPDNCKWATRMEQARNKRTNQWITFNNKTQLIVDWAREIGINKNTLAFRINRMKWSVERALTEPVKIKN